MKNNNQILGLAILLILFSFQLEAKVESTFLSGNLEEVKQRAGIEGKLYMVDFVAKWCLPCKWMDETTFADPQVTSYLADNYIPTKIDIDNFEGFNYKNEYQVEVLPTILIFNSKGEIVGRYEESLPPSKMLSILSGHNSPENREKVIHQSTSVLESMVPVAEAPDYSAEPLDTYAEEENSEIAEETISTIPTVPALEVAEVAEMVVVTQEAEVAEEVFTPTVDENLFKMTASNAQRHGYAVQVGVFADYGNVLKESSRFQALYNQEVIVQVAQVNNKQVFKLLLGEFSNIEEAHGLRRLIESEGGIGITKDLSKI